MRADAPLDVGDLMCGRRHMRKIAVLALLLACDAKKAEDPAKPAVDAAGKAPQASDIELLRVKKDAGMLASLVAKWQTLVKGPCIKSLEDLMRLSDVEPEQLVDPWGSKYEFTCVDGGVDKRWKCLDEKPASECPASGVSVTSKGIDKIAGTADDITVTE